MRPLWRLAYTGMTRACSAYLRVGEPASAAYVGGSLGTGGPVYALSDIDLAIVLPDDRGARGGSRAAIARRWNRLTRLVPGVDDLVDCCVYQEDDLRDALRDSTITYGLESGASAYFGPAANEDKMRLLERPELYGATAAWRRVAGPDRLPPDPGRDPARRRIAAWLELQYLWRLAFELCIHPDRPGAANMCVKLVADPVRMWLWLAEGMRTDSREQALTEGLSRLRDQAPALERALSLQRLLRTSPRPPIGESLRSFLSLSARIARTIAAQVEGEGGTDVRLVGAGACDFALPHGAWEPKGHVAPGAAPRLLPLADWRAVVMPTMPDETFALLPGDPADPATLAEAGLVVEKGPYATLSGAGLMVRPFRGGHARLRALQCEVTDPVSFAVAGGRNVARFPDVLGWSARDTGRRAVAEHAAWLRHQRVEQPGERLGVLIGAARAGLFLESLEDGEPELPLTAAATMETLGSRVEGAGDIAAAALEAYRDFALHWHAPAASTISGLAEAVRALPSYARSGQ